jgi:hypothetical protein
MTDRLLGDVDDSHIRNSSIISVLEKPVDERTQDEVDLLVVLIKNLEFFKTREIKDKYYPEIVACFKIEKHKSESIVFNKGDQGNRFYVIIKGTVSVLIPNKMKIENLK